MVESPSAQTLRLRTLLDDIFSTDQNTFVSFTTHGVIVAPILQIIGHPNPAFNLTTGQVIPVLVKAQRNEVSGSEGSADPPSPAESCAPCSRLS